MKIGLISDTHNLLDPRVEELLAGVDQLVHGGDVCRPQLIAELEAIAPVTVVQGNNDSHLGWRETEVLEIAGRRLLIQHIVNPLAPSRALRERLRKVRPHLVVFGHTHEPFCRNLEGILYLNPGSAGAPRFGLPPSVCLLDLDGADLHPEFLSLDGRPLCLASSGS